MTRHEERAVSALVVLNLLLQVFDGVATWLGVGLGFGEGNPLVHQAMTTIGTGPALWAFKLQASACILLVWTLRHRSRLAAPALAFTAALYAACSVGPWSAVLAPHFLTLAS
ncbi:MAG: hypothetical protein KIT14_18035 [bacterium]|nr:hypothetical protein [bacterium]